MERLLRASGFVLAAALLLWAALPVAAGVSAAREVGSFGPLLRGTFLAALWCATAGLLGGAVVTLTTLASNVRQLANDLASLRAHIDTREDIGRHRRSDAAQSIVNTSISGALRSAS